MARAFIWLWILGFAYGDGAWSPAAGRPQGAKPWHEFPKRPVRHGPELGSDRHDMVTAGPDGVTLDGGRRLSLPHRLTEANIDSVMEGENTQRHVRDRDGVGVCSVNRPVSRNEGVEQDAAAQADERECATGWESQEVMDLRGHAGWSWERRALMMEEGPACLGRKRPRDGVVCAAPPSASSSTSRPLRTSATASAPSRSTAGTPCRGGHATGGDGGADIVEEESDVSGLMEKGRGDGDHRRTADSRGRSKRNRRRAPDRRRLVNAAGEGMTLVFRPGVPHLPVQRESATCAHGGRTRARGQPTRVMKEELEGGAGRGLRRQQRADQAGDPP